MSDTKFPDARAAIEALRANPSASPQVMRSIVRRVALAVVPDLLEDGSPEMGNWWAGVEQMILADAHESALMRIARRAWPNDRLRVADHPGEGYAMLTAPGHFAEVADATPALALSVLLLDEADRRAA